MPAEQAASAPSSGLRKEASLLQVVAYGIGNIVGAGIYVLIGDAAGTAGDAVWLAFLLGSVVALFTGLTYAELASMYPRAASEYHYIGKAYGDRRLAFTTEWTMLITEIIAATAVSLGFAGYLSNAIGTPQIPVAVALLVILTGVAMMGVRTSLRVNMVLSVIAVLGLLLIITSGIGHIGSASYLSSTNGVFGVLSATSLVFFAYIGFDNMSNMAEETKDPEKTIPRALLIAVAISTLLYVGVGIVSVALVEPEQLAGSDAPLALAASAALGPVAYDILTVAALLATFNTVLVLLIVSSRIIYGMAAERVLPSALATTGRNTAAPYRASLVVLAISMALIPLGSVSGVAEVTSFGSLLAFALVNVAMVHLRRVAPKAPRPFRAPISLGWFPLTGAAGVVSCLFLLTQFNLTTVGLGLTLPTTGLVVYQLTVRKKEFRSGSIHEPHEAKG